MRAVLVVNKASFGTLNKRPNDYFQLANELSELGTKVKLISVWFVELMEFFYLNTRILLIDSNEIKKN